MSQYLTQDVTFFLFALVGVAHFYLFCVIALQSRRITRHGEFLEILSQRIHNLNERIELFNQTKQNVKK